MHHDELWETLTFVPNRHSVHYPLRINLTQGNMTRGSKKTWPVQNPVLQHPLIPPPPHTNIEKTAPIINEHGVWPQKHPACLWRSLPPVITPPDLFKFTAISQNIYVHYHDDIIEALKSDVLKEEFNFLMDSFTWVRITVIPDRYMHLQD